MPAPTIVLDTNIVLDLFVFRDDATLPVQQALQAGQLHWLATSDMREELARVLGYRHIVPRLAFHGLAPQGVMACFDSYANIVQASAKADITCKDPDDQKFVDLAVAHRCLLLSKDRALLCMARRFAARGVLVAPRWSPGC